MLQYLTPRTERLQQGPAGEAACDGEQHSQTGRGPETVATDFEGLFEPTAPEMPRNGGGGRVSQEHHQSDHGLHHGGGNAHARELCGAQVADDRRIRQQEQRLRNQRAERGDSERQDLPVQGPGVTGRCCGCGFRGWGFGFGLHQSSVGGGGAAEQRKLRWRV